MKFIFKNDAAAKPFSVCRDSLGGQPGRLSPHKLFSVRGL